MTKPTLEEIYSLKEPMLDDNFDLDCILFSESVPSDSYQGLLIDGAFQKIRLAIKAIYWREHAVEDSILTIVFMEQLDDQIYLDAFAGLKNEFAHFVFNIYNMAGEVVRKIAFNEPSYMSVEMALDAANGKPVHRVMQFSFIDVTETAVGP
uniref:Uncharacterized protein n=1 Tax=Pseudomonas phage HRDY3 TaxID=3236930 RepID=A0AB39CDP9_9VIRU